MTATVNRTPCKNFEYGYVRKESELSGRMYNFRPHWWAQYLDDGTSDIFDTKAECLAWMKSWNEIGE